MLEITSSQNPRVKDLLKLQDRRGRKQAQQVLVEGWHEIQLALGGHTRLETLFWCPALVRPGEESLLQAIGPGVEVITVGSQILAKLCYREHPDAWLGVFRAFDTSLETFDSRLGSLSTPPLMVLAEDVEKPGNIGAILRSLDAAGGHGLMCAEARTDLANPNVIRGSKGTVFTIPCVESTNESILPWLKDRDITVVAASPSGTLDLWDSDLRGPTIIAVGAEKEGLSSFWMDQAKVRLRIPMAGSVNSLNVAQAATIILYEAARQRLRMR